MLQFFTTAMQVHLMINSLEMEICGKNYSLSSVKKSSLEQCHEVGYKKFFACLEFVTKIQQLPNFICQIAVNFCPMLQWIYSFI